MKKEEEKEEADKANLKTIKQNQKLIEQTKKITQNRHVKVKNEPVFDVILESFHNSYAKEVASKSSLEILKLFRKDEL